MNTVIQLRPSQSEKPTVRGGRAKNADYRQREYLTEGEIDSLLGAAGNSRNPGRDRLLILMAFRHAPWVSELTSLRWQEIDLDAATVHIRRAKRGTPGIHGLQGDEMRLLRALRRDASFYRQVGAHRRFRSRGLVDRRARGRAVHHNVVGVQGR